MLDAVVCTVIVAVAANELGLAGGRAVPTPTLMAEEQALALAEAGVRHNADWTPYIEKRNGVLMALVPAGCFMMGSTEYSDERPIHEVCFERPFWIDVYEVTNAQYGEASANCLAHSSAPDQPRVCINWYEARAHCESRGARLPTEAEWEYAARGPDGLAYPWGNEFDCSRGNFDDEIEIDSFFVTDGAGCDGFGVTSPVGNFPEGVSWVGAYDLSGNVLEWVNDWYGSYPSERQVNPQGVPSGDYRVLRGGSWGSDFTYLLRSAYRISDDPVDAHSFFGFRCALSY